METVKNILMVMAGGSLGAVCRYGFALASARYIGIRFPWGTLLANMTGCFLIGAAFALSEKTQLLSPSARLFFMTGFLGALTTFSTFALETVNKIRDDGLVAIFNVLVNNLGGGFMVLAGIWLIGFILKGGK